jgi:trk system potassium uptake protein TrkH
VFALLILSVIATLRQRKEAEAMGRAIADSLVRKAATIAICYALLLTTSTLLLSLSEGYPLQVVMFEAISAGTTTGLSLGLTPNLTPFGKVVIIATMFLGRVGPLALFGALVFASGPRRPYGYAHEGVALG